MVGTWGRGVAALAAMVVLVGVAAPPARADTVLYSNLGPGGGYGQNGNFLIGSFEQLGFEFTTAPGASAQVSRIEIAAALAQDSNDIILWLTKDDNGMPGFGLQSYELVGGLQPPPGSVVTFTSTDEPILAPDTHYWLLANMNGINGDNPEAEWYYNSTGATGVEAVGSPGNWSFSSGTIGAFAVYGTQLSTPEPGSLTLVALGAAVLLGAGLRPWRAPRGRAPRGTC